MLTIHKKKQGTCIVTDEKNQKNEGHPAACFSFQKSVIWSLKRFPERGGGNGGGNLGNSSPILFNFLSCNTTKGNNESLIINVDDEITIHQGKPVKS